MFEPKPKKVFDYKYRKRQQVKQGMKSVNFILLEPQAIMLQEMVEYYGATKSAVITKALEEYFK